MTFLSQISAHTTIPNHVVISVFYSEDRIIVDNLFRRDSNMKSKHAGEIAEILHPGGNGFHERLKMQGNMLD